jgi:hypothetical protein
VPRSSAAFLAYSKGSKACLREDHFPGAATGIWRSAGSCTAWPERLPTHGIRGFEPRELPILFMVLGVFQGAEHGMARSGEETSNALFQVLSDSEHQLKPIRYELPEVQP